MNKNIIYLVMALLIASAAYAVVDVVNQIDFTNNLFSENLTFTSPFNITRFLSIPKGSSLLKFSLILKNLQGGAFINNATADALNSTNITWVGDRAGDVGLAGAFVSWFNVSNDLATSTQNWDFVFSYNITFPELGRPDPIVWRYSIRGENFFNKNDSLQVNVSIFNFTSNEYDLFQYAKHQNGTCEVTLLEIPQDYLKNNSLAIRFALNLTETAGASGNIACDGEPGQGVPFNMFPSNTWYFNRTQIQPFITVGGAANFSTGNMLAGESVNATFNVTVIKNMTLSCNCVGCTETATACIAPVRFENPIAGTLNYLNVNLSYFPGSVDLCTDQDFNFTVLNVTYQDEADNENISASNLFTLNFEGVISQELNGSFPESDSTAWCTNIDPATETLDFDITGSFFISKDLYAPRLYSFAPGGELPASNRPTNNETFFLLMLNESTTVAYTWLTTAFQPINGIMNLYRCAGDGSRTLVDAIPIIDSQASANIELLNVPYSYEVVTLGKLFTDPTGFTQCHIESQTELTFFVDILEEGAEGLIGFTDLQCNLTKTGSADMVRLDWGVNAEDSNLITGCVTARQHTINGFLIIYQNCSTTSGFSRTVLHNNVDYNVRGQLFQSGFIKECQSEQSFSFQTGAAQNFGPASAFAVVLIVLAMILMFSGKGEGSLIGAGIGLIVAWIVGITQFNWIVVSAMLFFLAIIGFVGRMSQNG